MYNSIFLFLNMGTPEIMIIMFAALLLFGGKKIPELARGLGKGIREFKDASEGVKREIHNSINNVTDNMDVNTTAKSVDFSNSTTSTADVPVSENIVTDKHTSTGDVIVPEDLKTEH